MSGLPVTELTVAASCILLGSFVAGCEASVSSLPEARLRALRDEIGTTRAKNLQRYMSDPTRVLSKLLAVRVTALVTAAVLATNALARGRETFLKLAVIVTVLVMAYGLLAELFMTIGRARARTLAPVLLAVTRPFEILITPIAAPLLLLGRATQSFSGLRSASEPPPVTEREVEYLVEEAENSGGLDPKRGQMLVNVLELKDTTARDVMIPRTRMHAIEAGTSLERTLAIVTEEGHSRVPVFKGQTDNIVGVLHVKDLFRIARAGGADGKSMPPLPDSPIEAIARKPPFFVAESHSALSLLRDMQSRRTHMAMVVDEFGAVAGLVTLEDILERLVGDIQDEHDADEALFTDQGDGRYLASGAISTADLGDHLGVEFPDVDTYASLGGFIADRAGKVPALGTVVEWNGLRFIVREGDARHASKVEIIREKAKAVSGAPAAQAAE